MDKVIFVGSVEVGKKVQEACIPRLTPLVLELGGKDAFVIWYIYLRVYVCVRACVCVCGIGRQGRVCHLVYLVETWFRR